MRPKITQQAINLVTQVMDKQDEKGLEKYGCSIDEGAKKDYDWGFMIAEEMADALKYAMVIINEKDEEIERLKFNLKGREAKSNTDLRIYNAVVLENTQLKEELNRIRQGIASIIEKPS